MYHGKFQETNVKLFNENFGSNVHNRLLGVNTSQLQCINKGSIAIELIRTGSTIAKWLRSWNLIPDSITCTTSENFLSSLFLNSLSLKCTWNDTKSRVPSVK